MENKTLKKYKYQFNKNFYAVAIFGSLVAVACLVLNVIRFINLSSKGISPSFYEYVSLVVSVVLSIAFVVFVITAICDSYYIIENDFVLLKWGVIQNKLKSEEFKEIKLITNQNKLELIFKDDSYFVIAVSKSWQEEFINEIKAKYPSVLFIQETEAPSEK